MSSESLQSQLSQGLLVKHPEFWFSDGSLILRAHSTLFRVHISQLCRKSVFFRDLFSLPQPSEPDRNERQLEGCPVLDLHDSPEDVANLVKVIYDGPNMEPAPKGSAVATALREDVEKAIDGSPSHYANLLYQISNFGSNDRRDFIASSGVLRLSSKYLIEETTRQKALAHIRTAWPSTLKGWDLREDVARAHEAETGQPRGNRYPHPIAVINLAREIGADDLLPAAFYELSRHSFAQIFEPAPGSPLDPRDPNCPTSLSHTLCPADLQRLALGKEAAQHAVTALIQNMEHAASDHQSHRRQRSTQHAIATGVLGMPGLASGLGGGNRGAPPRRAMCVTPAACRKDLAELVELATQHYLFDRERGCADPLYVAEELGQLKSAEFADCAACAHALEAWAARERERLWRAIPEWFRLR
ncbi:hypothetical protein LXA43DRAFT_1068289 [Ganoderma leucocontextum]|nr:hypothetical protein LXA43DRAFT_1068289 [Ganoderma leucocontextum]